MSRAPARRWRPSRAAFADGARPARFAPLTSLGAVIVCGVVAALLMAYASSQGAKTGGVVFGGLLALGCWPILAYFPGFVERTLLFALSFTLPISLKFHLAFRAEHLGGAIGYRIAITDIIVLLLVAAVWLRGRKNRALQPVLVDRPIALAFGAYLCFAILSMIGSNDVQLGLFQVSATLEAFLVFVFLYNYLNDRERIRTFIAGLLVGLLLQSSVGIVQAKWPGKLKLTFLGQAEDVELHVVGGRVDLPDVDRGTTFVAGEVTERPTGLLIHPNVLASYLAIMIPVALAVWLGCSAGWLSALGFSSLCLACVTLYLSLSRSGWFGTAAAFGLALVCWWRWRRSVIPPAKRAFLCAMALVALIGAGTKAETIYLRLTETAGEAIDFRVTLLRAAFGMVEDHPMLGVGLNTFVNEVEHYDSSGMSRIKRFPVHNLLMLELSEVGLLGGLAFLILLLTTVVRTMRSAKRCNSLEFQMLAVCLASGLVGFWLTDLSGFTFRLPIMTTFIWCCVALVLALYRVEKSRAA